MPMLYVANPTIQNQRVYYRLDFNAEGQRNPNLKGAFKLRDIAPGRQEPVGGTLAHPMQVQEIIQQLRTYGALDVSEVGGQRHFVHHIFSVDRPIPKAVIERVHEQNKGIQTEQGRQRRIAAALAANEILNNTVDEATPPPFTVEFEQDEQSELGEKRIEEGYHVVADARPDAPQPKAQRAPRQKKAA